MNQDYPKTWKHYQKKGFHFQLTQWSTKDFSMINILRNGVYMHGQPNAVLVSQSIPGWASVSFQSFKLEDLNEKLIHDFGLSVVSNLKGIIGYSDEFPSENSVENASNYIMNANWYIVKMERIGSGENAVYKQSTSPFLWRSV